MELAALKELARLVKQRNAVEQGIVGVIGRPAQIGHLGEYVASQVFDLELEHSATQAGYDGVFRSGPLAGKNANVKWYAKHEGLLDINPDHMPDYYLVLAGPKSGGESSRGKGRPWKIESVFLLKGSDVFIASAARGVRIGEATSVPKAAWEASRVYPQEENCEYRLTEDQVRALSLFE